MYIMLKIRNIQKFTKCDKPHTSTHKKIPQVSMLEVFILVSLRFNLSERIRKYWVVKKSLIGK